jgi:hypothetical protein
VILKRYEVMVTIECAGESVPIEDRPQDEILPHCPTPADTGGEHCPIF